MDVQYVLTNSSKTAECILAVKCFRAVVPVWGNFSDKNAHSSRLLHQILICEYLLHSGLHFWPNGSAFIKNDNGPFSLVKCSAYILNSLLIIATKCRGFCKWQAIFQISAFMLCFTMSLWHCRRGIFPHFCNDKGDDFSESYVRSD